MKLNIGCGKDIRRGYINLDIKKFEGVDAVHNLNKFPYPFKKDYFDEVRATAVLEHINDLPRVMREIHRICKKDAKVIIGVPYWNSLLSWNDPEHKRGFTLDTFTFFPELFFVESQKLNGSAVGRLLPNFCLRYVSFFICNIVESITIRLVVKK